MSRTTFQPIAIASTPLQLLDLTAECGLRDSQPARGPPEVFFFGCDQDVAKLAEFH